MYISFDVYDCGKCTKLRTPLLCALLRKLLGNVLTHDHLRRDGINKNNNNKRLQCKG